MKNSAIQSPKDTLNIYRPDYVGAEAVDNSSAAGSGSDQDLAEVVWKYFGQEISEVLKEVQEVLTPEKSRSIIR